MNTLQVEQNWFDDLLPEGLPIPSTLLLSGPGGSGKPLIGNVIVASWLRQGGSVVFMSLQYPDHTFIKSSLSRVAGLDLDAYQDRVATIELDATITDMTEIGSRRFKANVVKPSVWDAALEQACSLLPNQGPGILIFISALNLLLFSPTYGEDILDKMMETTRKETGYTYLFSASTTAKADAIAKLEDAVDHLIVTRSTKSPFQLYMEIKRIHQAPFSGEEIQVPFSAQDLNDVKEIADHSRKRVIPEVRKL